MSLLFIITTAIFKAIQDLLAHGKLGLPDWWFNQDSWKLKWEGGDPEQGERFFGSSTVFVWTTDAWHFFGMLRNFAMIFAIVFYQKIFTWWIDAILFWTIHNLIFSIAYWGLPRLIKRFVK